MSRRGPKAPDSLGVTGAAFWRRIVRAHELDAEQLGLLEAACQALDIATKAHTTLLAEGLSIPGERGGSRTHPAAAIARDARSSFAKLLGQIGLEAEEPPAPRLDMRRQADRQRAARLDDTKLRALP